MAGGAAGGVGRASVRRFVTGMLDALAACVRTMFQVGLGLMQWNLDAAKALRRERERRRQEGERK
jgi:hypothetical protein